MRRSYSRNKQIVWIAAASLWIVGIAAGWFGLIWPYYVAFVIALVAFELWYFRDSLRGKWHRSR